MALSQSSRRELIQDGAASDANRRQSPAFKPTSCYSLSSQEGKAVVQSCTSFSSRDTSSSYECWVACADALDCIPGRFPLKMIETQL